MVRCNCGLVFESEELAEDHLLQEDTHMAEYHHIVREGFEEFNG